MNFMCDMSILLAASYEVLKVRCARACDSLLLRWCALAVSLVLTAAADCHYT